jgi:hypothetical protein
MSPAGGHIGFSIGPELASDMYIFRPISFLAHLTRSELLPSLGVRRPFVNISIFF